MNHFRYLVDPNICGSQLVGLSGGEVGASVSTKAPSKHHPNPIYAVSAIEHRVAKLLLQQ